MSAINEADIERIIEQVVSRVRDLARDPGTKGSTCGCEPSGGSHHGCSCATPAPVNPAAILNQGAERVSQAHDRPGAGACGTMARYIDHTMLKADATDGEIDKLCDEAREFQFASVCVNTSYVERCAARLSGSGVKVCCVVGFPLGAMSTDSKAFETRDAVSRGAEEVDMVVNVGQLQSGNFGYIYNDISAVVKAAAGNPVKVILETALLDEDEKISACVLAKAAGAAFVKTSTGFGPGGATSEDVALMRRIVGPAMGVKASGGIRDCDTALKMVDSGATRLGASASVGIVRGAGKSTGY